MLFRKKHPVIADIAHMVLWWKKTQFYVLSAACDLQKSLAENFSTIHASAHRPA